MARNGPYLLGLTPAALLLALFFVAPAVWAAGSSLTNLSLVGLDAAKPRFVGVDNYLRLASDPDFWTVIRNSIVFVTASAIVGQFVLGLGLALLIDHAERRGWRFATVAYAAVLLAWVNPTLIAGFLWVAMFDFYFGSLNMALKAIGLQPQNWLGNQAMLAIIVANTWRGTAFTLLIFLSGLKTIPAEIYEAARV